MIDLHCHILPGVDDGSRSSRVSLAMAAMAEESGVTDIAATPHFQYDREDAAGAKERLAELTEVLQNRMRAEGISVRLHTGAEILCTEQTPELLNRGLLPTIGGTRYLLVEFMFDTPAEEIDEMLLRLEAEGVSVLLAHPERYHEVQQRPEFLVRWFRRGVVLQCNKGSILGSLGQRSLRTAYWMLDRGLAHIVASDAHTEQVRTPHMAEVKALLEEQWGEEYAAVLLTRNPSRIIRNRPVLRPDGEW